MIRLLSGCCLALCAGLATLGGSILGTVEIRAQSVGHLGLPLSPVRISQPFGCTSYVFEPLSRSCPDGHFHSGLDLAAAAGTPVRAAAAGEVTVTRDRGGYGLHIVIDHAGGLATLYGHLSHVEVITGQYVEAGEVIGEVGSTGNSTGPHLHFEVRRAGVPEDPAPQLAPTQSNP